MEKKYQGLFRVAYLFSTINRKAYDEKSTEANRVFFGFDRGRGYGVSDEVDRTTDTTSVCLPIFCRLLQI